MYRRFRPPPPVRPRPVNKKSDATAPKPPPSRGGKPPSGAAAAAGKKVESRFSKGLTKDDKGSGTSKSAPPKGKESVKASSEDSKEEKIVEEEKEERRFDPSGYDKDLVEILGKRSFYLQLIKESESINFRFVFRTGHCSKRPKCSLVRHC